MTTSTVELVGKASALLQSSQAERALELLAPHASNKQDDVVYLQTFGEALLENNQVETAYQVLIRGCELDPEAEHGTEKFLYLGQIIGGVDGLNYIDAGLTRLESQLKCIEDDSITPDAALVELGKIYSTKNSIASYLIKKLNQGIFAKIEIWMTDLCMEPEAESQCDNLITSSLKWDTENPEAWSLLASIRISQQRSADAQEALVKAWSLFQIKKTTLEDAASKSQQPGHSDESGDFDVNMEYAELLQPLLTLAKLAIESELYEIAISASSGSQDINESLLESYYYEGLACLLQAKKLHVAANKSGEDYREIQLSSSTDEEAQSFLEDARIALTHGFKLCQGDASEMDEEVAAQVNELLNEVGGPLMSELLPKRGGAEEYEGWEEDIESDEE
ncbi:assembly chaperone of RPL4 [[Candida] anglica]